ncbi:MAG: hypothetical protein ACOX6N_04875 [Patescibacteria group bacterium]|jgi:hypothetical protein
MNSALYDIRFAYKFDNPFPNDPNKEYLKELKKYLATNQEKFTEVNYLNDSRYLIICPETKRLFGEDVSNPKTGYAISDTTSNPLSSYVKEFVLNVNGISDELRSWASKKTSSKPQPIDTGSLDGGGGSNESNMKDGTEGTEGTRGTGGTGGTEERNYEDFIPLMPNKFSYPSTSSITNYDISNDKSISYEDLRKLTINIARSKLIPEMVRDETVVALEREKKKNLIQQITRYRNVKVIAMMDDSDLNEMSLSQLETCLEQCIKYHENFKTLELFKRGFGCGGVLYDMVFPDGIPISKTKRLCFKGVGKEILSTLFDPHTPVGLAFSNILQKHNIHVSDELLTLVAFAGICISKVTVEDVKPKDDEKDEGGYGYGEHYVNDNSLNGVKYSEHTYGDDYNTEIEEVSDEEY